MPQPQARETGFIVVPQTGHVTSGTCPGLAGSTSTAFRCPQRGHAYIMLTMTAAQAPIPLRIVSGGNEMAPSSHWCMQLLQPTTQ